jgi:hypothetical protein
MPKKDNSDESVLESAAKTIGKAAGKVAAVVGVEGGETIPAAARPATPKTEKVGKLVKKNKSRLPRREKKALQKAATKQARAEK